MEPTLEKRLKPGSIAFQYSSYSLEEPTWKSEDFTEPKMPVNTYTPNSEGNHLSTQANSIRIPKRSPARKPLPLNESGPYNKSFTDTNGCQQFSNEENDDEPLDYNLNGGEIEADLETDGDFNYSNNHSVGAPNNWKSEDFTEPKMPVNTYTPNSEGNHLSTQANSIRIPKRSPARKPLPLNESGPYNKSFTDTNGCQQFSNEENDDEPLDYNLNGGEIEADLETDGDFNYSNNHSVGAPNNWEPENNKCMNFGDYIRKNSDKTEHVYAHLGNSLEDAEYYFIKKSDEDIAQKSSLFFGNDQYDAECHYHNMMGDQAIFRDEFACNDSIDYSPEEFINEYYSPKKETRASGSSQNFRIPAPDKFSKDFNLNTKKKNARKDDIYKEILDKIDETISDLKCAGVEDNTKPFLSSSDNLNKIQRCVPHL